MCVALAVAGLSLTCAPRLAFALDSTDPLRDLARSADFRVRVSAAVTLGRTRPPGAREALEIALGDKHPAVRIAAANALVELGDPLAVAALGRRLGSESSPSVKAQMQSAIQQLQRGVTADQGGGRRGLGPSVRYVVRLGPMRNATSIRGDEMRTVLHDAIRSRARALKGAAVAPDGDSTLLSQASGRRLPVMTLEGSLTQLAETRIASGFQVQARVECLVRREQVLKGTLTGGATTYGTSPTLSDLGRRRLQDDAVAGAVESALRGADQGLLVAGL
ncbi:MAG TPA: HEAT repeat domain-containing protein [Polyangiaceae bacterium]